MTTVYPYLSIKVYRENDDCEIKIPLGINHGYNDCFCQKMNEVIKNKKTTLINIFENCLNNQDEFKKCEMYFGHIKIIAKTFYEYVKDTEYTRLFESIAIL